MPKIYEKSAGGIVYRKLEDGKVEVLLLEWLNSRGQLEFAIPKGHMEKGEKASETALRETAEETGLDKKDLSIIKFITKLNYTFTAGHLANNPLVDKDVYLFLIKYRGLKEPTPEKEERFVGYRWVDVGELKNFDVKFDLQGIVNKNKAYFI